MTETGVFRTDRASLLACADVLAGQGRWADAARFAERAVPDDDPDHTMRIEVIWWLLRAGRARDAAVRLAAMPDSGYTDLVLLRLATAGLSDRDKAPMMLRALLTEVSQRPPTPVGLRLVVLLALAADDRTTALNAANRYVRECHPQDQEMAPLLAVERALNDDLDASVQYTEYAVNGRKDDRAAAIREVVDEVAARGDALTSVRVLANGFLTTGRDEYAELLLPRLPVRVRWRNRIIGIGVSALVLGVGLMVTGIDALLAGGLAVMLSGTLTAVWAAFASSPGLNRPQTNRLTGAYAQYRSRHGQLDMGVAVAAAGAAGFTMSTMFAQGENFGPLPAAALVVVVCVGLLAAGVAAGTVTVYQRRARAKLARARQPVSPDPCRCWEMDGMVGELWQPYVEEHLVTAGTEPTLDAQLRRCPQTDKAWLHLLTPRITLAVRFPQEREEPYGAGYL